jgi:hypothetical protein
MCEDNAVAERQFLAGWVNRPVTVSGILEISTEHNVGGYKSVLAALVLDLEVLLPNRERHTIDHTWIQHAETLKHLKPGDRFRCRCVVNAYRKCGVDRTLYGLKYPNNVEQLTKPPALRTPERFPELPTPAPTPSLPSNVGVPAVPILASAKPKPQPVNLLGSLDRVTEVVNKAGGIGLLKQLYEAVVKIGGWDKALEIKRLLDELGGWEKLEQLLALLKSD